MKGFMCNTYREGEREPEGEGRTIEKQEEKGERGLLDLNIKVFLLGRITNIRVEDYV